MASDTDISASETGRLSFLVRPIAGFVPLAAATLTFLALTIPTGKLLGDPDSYWHIVTAEWIFENGFPTTDSFSFTKAGQPWIAKEWLAQISYGLAFRAGGWTAVIALAAAAFAASFVIVGRALERHLSPIATAYFLALAFMLAASHALARPHLLVMPVVVLWAAGLVRALDREAKPPFLILPLMVLWANLHGSFLLGILLAGAAGLEAILATPRKERFATAAQWGLFCVAAVAASCLTPYGIGTAQAALKVLTLGDLLPAVREFRPPDFSKPHPLEFVLLAGIGLAFWSGFRLPVVRILVILGLLHLALSGERYSETLGLIAPLYLAAPIARQFPRYAAAGGDDPRLDRRTVIAGLLALTIAAVATLSLWRLAPAPVASVSPVAAVSAIKAAGLKRVFNDYNFGGYMIWVGQPTFVDGRAELYGPDFLRRYHRAVVALVDAADLTRLLDEYDIDATLLSPRLPAVAWFDLNPAWKRLYADDLAVVHIRAGGAVPTHMSQGHP
jgi:hypothetical protein